MTIRSFAPSIRRSSGSDSMTAADVIEMFLSELKATGCPAFDEGFEQWLRRTYNDDSDAAIEIADATVAVNRDWPHLTIVERVGKLIPKIQEIVARIK
jgi:hypothetical protein